MFERFTDRARRVVVLSQEQARIMNNNYIGTEHLLLGLIAEETGIAGELLRAKGLNAEVVRAQAVTLMGEGKDVPTGHIPFTQNAKKMLEFALRKAVNLGHNYIGTEHLLLALLGLEEIWGFKVLIKLGIDPVELRDELLEKLSQLPTTAPKVLIVALGVPADSSAAIPGEVTVGFLEWFRDTYEGENCAAPLEETHPLLVFFNHLSKALKGED